MAGTKNKSSKISTSRIMLIDKEIASGKYPTAQYLADKFGVAKVTIYKTIQYMIEDKHIKAPIKNDPKTRGYYYTNKNFRLATSHVTAEDLLSVELVKELMELYRDTPIYSKVDDVFKKITSSVNNTENLNWYKDRIIVPKAVTVPVNPDVWQNILTALQENRVISFNYSKGNPANLHDNRKNKTFEKKEERRIFHPYQLMFDRVSWYLFGYDEGRNDERIFYVPRISDVSILDKSFDFKPDFDYRKNNGLSYFGIFSGKNSYKFEIEIFGDPRWIKDIRIAEDQNVRDTETGAIVSFTSNQLEKVLGWVLGQGPTARPVKPDILVDSWKKAVSDMAKLTTI